MKKLSRQPTNIFICNKCNEEVKEFVKGRRLCKDCWVIVKREYDSKYYNKNREKILFRQQTPEHRKRKREYYQRNKVKILEREKELKQTPKYKERIKKYCKDYRNKNLNKIMDYQHKYVEENRERLNRESLERMRAYYKENKKNLKFKRFLIKQKRIREMGGKCEECGYDEILSILHFHHKNPEDKENSCSQEWKTKSKFNKNKFRLLCPNCHFKLHYLIRVKRGVSINEETFKAS